MTPLDLDSDLAHLREALHIATGQDLARAAARHRSGVRRGITGGTLVAAAAVIAVMLVNPSSSGQSAWARQALQRAAAVISPAVSSDQILHITAVETLTPGVRRLDSAPVARLTEQAWIRGGKHPYERAELQSPGGPVLEEFARRGIYDKTNNAIYPFPKIPGGSPHYTLTPKGSADSYTLTAQTPSGQTVTQKLDAHDAHALRAGTEVTSWAVFWDAKTQKQHLEVIVSGRSSNRPLSPDLVPSPASTNFAAELRGLLTAGDAQVSRTTTTDGKPAIEITQPEKGATGKIFRRYYVTPHTYRPLELDTYSFGSPADDTRIKFGAYQTIPLAGHEQLLHVRVPHSAHVDHNPKNWWINSALPRPF